jgi:hypothetical protein
MTEGARTALALFSAGVVTVFTAGNKTAPEIGLTGSQRAGTYFLTFRVLRTSIGRTCRASARRRRGRRRGHFTDTLTVIIACFSITTSISDLFSITVSIGTTE